ncbi:MAG: SEL1-like repeat protein [Beijerinckiaceae bacterium]
MPRLSLCQRDGSVFKLLVAAGLILCGASQNIAAAEFTRIKVNSDAVVLADPLVKACSRNAGNGYGLAAEKGSAVVAAAQLDLEKVYKAVIECRRALAKYPTEPSVITYNNIVSTSLWILLFGIKSIPEIESERVAKTMEKVGAAPKRAENVIGSMYYFFLGQAHAFGVGVDRNLDRAAYWYGLSADNVSRSELDGLVRIDPSLKRWAK